MNAADPRIPNPAPGESDMLTRDDIVTGSEWHVTAPYGRPCSDRRGPVRWRRNGATRTWKRDAQRVETPVKHGLRDYDTLTTADIGRTDIHRADRCPDAAR